VARHTDTEAARFWHEARYWRSIAQYDPVLWRWHKEGLRKRRGDQGLALLVEEMCRQHYANEALIPREEMGLALVRPKLLLDEIGGRKKPRRTAGAVDEPGKPGTGLD
jgi:hypothetical protein